MFFNSNAIMYISPHFVPIKYLTPFSFARGRIVVINLADRSDQHALSKFLGDKFVSYFLLIAVDIVRVKCEIASKGKRDYLVYVLIFKLNKVIPFLGL